MGFSRTEGRRIGKLNFHNISPSLFFLAVLSTDWEHRTKEKLAGMNHITFGEGWENYVIFAGDSGKVKGGLVGGFRGGDGNEGDV